MRLLRVIASMSPAVGGPVEAVRQFSRVHARMGHRTEVVCLDDPGAAWIAALTGAGEGIGAVHALGPGRWGWAYSARLIPWLRENAGGFDAVVVHGLWLHPSYAVWRTCRPRRGSAGVGGASPAYFVMPHGMLDPWFQRNRRFKAVRNVVYWWLIEHRVVRDAAALLFTCEEERRLARVAFWPYRCRERVVSYGTGEPPRYVEGMAAAFRDRCPALGARPYLLYLGRLHPKKGLEDLLRAWVDLWRERELEGLILGVDLVIAGPCRDRAYERRLRELAGGGVHFVGELAGDAKWGALHGADAFVLPSHQENFGIAVVEALGCGKPVLITTRVNIWREIVADGAGWAEEDTVAGAGRLLRAWLAWREGDSSARAGMIERARGCFARRYDARVAAVRFLDALEEGGGDDGG